jgi:hypothetical protein
VSGLTPERVTRWLPTIQRRHSRRSYNGLPLDASDLDGLEELAAAFRPFPGARAVLVREAPATLFVGIVGFYGGISRAPSALVFIGDDDTCADVVGYTGEALVLEATARGLDTCWVGGVFSGTHAADSAGAAAGERVFAVSPVGHAHEDVTLRERLLFKGGRPKRRLPPEVIAPGSHAWPQWASAMVDVVRPAPSAMNRQPWRLRMDGASLVISVDGGEIPRISKRLDCGIAMLHAELGAASAGVRGTWEILTSPDVARFTPTDATGQISG